MEIERKIHARKLAREIGTGGLCSLVPASIAG